MADDLVPVFIPPLATWLARAEAVKGSRLTESEVLRIRDGADCMMMTVPDAAKLTQERGYRDVEPENCWADWHRLRVQMTGVGCLPKFVLCFLGDQDLVQKCGPILEGEKIEHEWAQHDGRMSQAFQASAQRIDPSLGDDDLTNISNHATVLYVLSKNFAAHEGPAVSLSFLRLSARLLAAGATALKCESAGIAHGRSRWLELAKNAVGDDCWPSLLRAFVQMPIWDGTDYYTCGMHLLGKPDLIVADSLLRDVRQATENQAWAAVDLFRGFGLYLLDECGEGQFASGHKFSLNAEEPRFRVIWEECTNYEEDEFFFNPFGRWRFTSPTAQLPGG